MAEEERMKLYSIPDIDIPPSPPLHPPSSSSATQSSASTGSNILDILTLPSSFPQSNRIKPSQPKRRKKKKKPMSEYRPPSPFSPKPDYKSMDIEQIKKQAMKYGLSTAQSKGRLVKILDEIYNVTHQYETDTDYEFELDPIKPSKDLSHTPPTPAIIPESKKARKRPAIHQMSSSDETEENRPPPMKKPTPSTTSDEDDFDHQGRFLELTVHELSSNTSSSSLSIHGTPPTNLPMNDSPKKPKTNPKGAKKPKLETPTIPLKELVRNYIESKPQLHARILCYEPIDFEEFHKQMKTDLNMKIVSKELMQCLDDQCITFTLRSRKGAFTSVMRAKRRHK